MTKGSCYRVVSDHDFSQLTLLPLLVLSTCGLGLEGLDSYLLYCFWRSRSLSRLLYVSFHSQLILPAAVALIFPPPNPSGQNHAVGPH
jgi:hypothetical protein